MKQMPEKTKTDKNTGVVSVLRFAAYCLLLFGATVILTPDRGVWRTLPLTVILPAAATFFYPKRLFTVGMTGVLALLFSMVASDSFGDAVVTAVLAMLFASLGILVKRLIVTCIVNRGREEKRAHGLAVFSVIAAVVLFAVSLLLYALLFGTPFSQLNAEKANRAYLDGYTQETLTVGSTYYDAKSHRYFTDVILDAGEIRAKVSVKKDDVCDGIREYYAYGLLDDRRVMITDLLRRETLRDVPAVRIGTIETDGMIDRASTLEETAPYMTFDIALPGQLLDRDAFASLCEDCRDALLAGGIDFCRITFYGGTADRFSFRASVTPDTSPVDVMPFEEQAFTRYEDEKAFRKYWDYGNAG